MNKEREVPKLGLPKFWQVLQLVSLQIFAGGFGTSYLLTIEQVKVGITKGYGASNYAIILATFYFITVVSGFLAGTKGMEWLVDFIKQLKFSKDE